ncbi:hypothetical protein [Flavobacterium foetidum]|uniref:hypothetical protein n=1 Tax=Flavobacterium foetidum TaxID=2026681 RepID=UPI001075215A|nr:hypothetical protein [Flavobacterium foetidum]KAF2517153.1 hypothetical protein E0W73_03390 [Flavobacterium foetidum]
MYYDEREDYGHENQDFQYDNYRETEEKHFFSPDHSISDNAEPDYGNDFDSQEFNNETYDNENLGSDALEDENEEFDNENFNEDDEEGTDPNRNS